MTDDARRSRPIDAGMANERTALAWSRTALTLAATAGLLIRLGVEHGEPAAGIICGGGLIIAAVAIWLHGAHAYRLRHDSWNDAGWIRDDGPIVACQTVLRLVAIASIAAACAATGITVITFM
jgi:uncharacterized membrane protein YidH (DUF202 family)